VYHYSVIKSINSTTVVLADSSLGIISMTLAEFTELFGSSGYVLVVSKFEINGSVNGTVLTRDQMKVLLVLVWLEILFLGVGILLPVGLKRLLL